MTILFDEKIKTQIEYAYASAPAIKDIMDKAGVSPEDVQTVTDLQKIPITSKDALVKIHQNNPPFGGFLAADPDTLPRIYISPGPIFDPQPPNLDSNEGTLAAFKYVGFCKGDRVLNTFMYHLTPAGLLIDEALQICGATVIPSGPGNTELQITIMQALGVSGFVGQPSYLMTLLDACEAMEIPKEAISIKKALFSAEPYTQTQQARFEHDYDMKTTSAYGTADLRIVGYTRTGIQGFCIVDSLFIEIVDIKTGKPLPDGEMGEIVVTTFNKGYPLVRFGTGDLGALSPQPQCTGQQLLGLFGRSGDAIKVRGMFLHPNQMMAVKTQFPQIKYIQAIITRPQNRDHIRILLELHENTNGADLPEKIKQLAQAAIRLRIDDVDIVDSGIINPSERNIKDKRSWE